MILRVGTSGWIYRDWRARFYPDELPAHGWLRFAAERMDALEINATFYRTQRPETFARWREEVADLVDARGFRFAVKGSRYLTHMLKLRGFERPLANFFASGPLLLGSALGPILWQLPPQLGFDEARLAAFLGGLPRTVGEAQRMTARHDARFAGRTTAARGPGLAANTPLLYALEPRHPAFADPAFFRLCARHEVSVVVAHAAWSQIVIAAPPHRGAAIAYGRAHGGSGRAGGEYTDAELLAWQAWIAAWRRRRVREAYVFFNNDVHAYAPHDADRLRAMMRSARPRSRSRSRSKEAA